jgi:hypothetical protein
MISTKSKKREIADLQRFLSEAGYLDFGESSQAGEWDADTTAAVVGVYEDLGWEHPKAGTWISAAALAAMAAGSDRSGGGSMTRGVRSGGGSMTRRDGGD